MHRGEVDGLFIEWEMRELPPPYPHGMPKRYIIMAVTKWIGT